MDAQGKKNQKFPHSYERTKSVLILMKEPENKLRIWHQWSRF